MSRSHFFSHDPFLPLRPWFIGTLLDTTRLHSSVTSHDTFALFCHSSFAIFRSRPFAPFGHDPIATFRSRSNRNLSVTIQSQPFGHDHLHPFGQNQFAPFWSWSRSVSTLSVNINFTSFGQDPFTLFRLWSLIGSLSVTTVLYIFGQNTFTSFQSQNVHTPWIMICLYLLDHNTFIPLRLRCVHIS